MNTEIENRPQPNKKIFSTFITLITFFIVIPLTVWINQPEYTPIDEFDKNDLERYKDGEVLYIKDTVTYVEYQQHNSLSMSDAYIYEVGTEHGFTFDIVLYNEHEKPYIQPGDTVVLSIEIYKREDPFGNYYERYGVNGYSWYEFVMKYNYNWLIIFIEGTTMALFLLYTWQRNRIRELETLRKIKYFGSVALLIGAVFFFYISSFINTCGTQCCIIFGVILLIIGISLLRSSLKKRNMPTPHAK